MQDNIFILIQTYYHSIAIKLLKPKSKLKKNWNFFIFWKCGQFLIIVPTFSVNISGGWWYFNQGMMSKKYIPSIFKMLCYFFLLFVKFIDKRRILSYISNLTSIFYNMLWNYSWHFEILGRRSIHSIHGPHATSKYTFEFRIIQ